MSTELKSIKAKIEIPNPPKMTSNYQETEVYLNRFWGGIERGTSLQITFLNENGNYSHIQLDNESIKELIKILKKNYL